MLRLIINPKYEAWREALERIPQQFDSSGEVLRGKDAGFSTNRLCRFANGKIYNCDLSASYNIGARYFIREIQKSISAKRWSDIQARVPECEKRTWCTYNTLLQINAAA